MHSKPTQLLCRHLINYYADTRGVTAFPPKRNLVPRLQEEKDARFGTWIGSKKVGKVPLEKIFSLPSSFFYRMLIPLDFVHFNFLPLSNHRLSWV